MGICLSTNCCNTGRKNPPRGTQRAGTNKMRTKNTRRNHLRLTAEPPIYCQVVRLVTFQDNNLTLSLTALRTGGYRPSPPARSSAAHETPELTENTTDAPKSATPMDPEGGNQFLTSPYKRGWGISNSPPTLTLPSCQWTVLEQTTITRLTSSRAKKLLQLKIPPRIFR